MRRFLLILGLVSLLVGGWTAVRGYRAGRDPEPLVSGERVPSAPFCPSPSALNRSASEHVREAIGALNEVGTDPRERLARFREHLSSAADLLELSLRVQPAQAETLARLAAVRWELSPPLTVEAERRHHESIELASRMAPRVPRVQRRLGELLLKMGLRDEALVFLRRTIELDPGRAEGIIDLLASQFFTLDEIVGALPKRPEVLLPLAGPFAGQGRSGEYADLLEPFLPEGEVALLGRYGNACLGADRADHLRRRLVAIGGGWGSESEAERMRQLARAEQRLGNRAEALRAARRAAETRPEEATYTIFLGELELASGEPQAALESFRQALFLLARSSGSPQARARVYGRIGQTEEALGRPEDAYDSYERALALDPGERTSARRLEEMGGFRPSRAPGTR